MTHTRIRALSVAALAALSLAACSSSDDSSTTASAGSSSTRSVDPRSTTPASSTAAAGECSYTRDTQQPAKRVDPPPADPDPALPTAAAINTNQGTIGITLDPAKAPCTVNSFVSLAEQGYFDGTSCHRLTTSAGLKVLQCGDPSGTGSGGPGYEFADEYPVGQSRSSSLYTRGVLAMANAGPNTNGSQFFLVYGDSQLTPDYTIFGTIDTAGLGVLDTVADAGVSSGGRAAGDGKPNLPVDIESVTLG